MDNPYTIRPSVNKATGNASTVFYTQQGSYVIVDDITKEIVQISDNINQSAWVSDSSIIDHIYQNEVNKMRITEINDILRKIECSGEYFFNLQELDELLNDTTLSEKDEVLIMPYYIQDNKRFELSQYEFYCSNDGDFKTYILKLTGKKQMEDIPEEIIHLREKCFATVDEPNKLKEFLEFLFQDKNLQKEVEKVFGDYKVENLYAIVY